MDVAKRETVAIPYNEKRCPICLSALDEQRDVSHVYGGTDVATAFSGCACVRFVLEHEAWLILDHYNAIDPTLGSKLSEFIRQAGKASKWARLSTWPIVNASVIYDVVDEARSVQR